MRVLVHNRIDEFAQEPLKCVLVPVAGLAATRVPVALDVDADVDSSAVPPTALARPPSRIVKSPLYNNGLQANPSRVRAFLTPSKRSAMSVESIVKSKGQRSSSVSL